ncbi:hypothetical protein [Pseudofulvibacter geojedonensis]|uniref:Uncharacterized protein n=1 Tax=Pseudofulvibacter geojedonensis TaxID=1123758 RepID=A0ABW3I3E0_9FLAO
MKLNNYSVNEYTQVLDKLARAKTVHNYTYTGYTELSFWSIIGWLFQSAIYIVVYPIIFLIISVIKSIKKEY